MKKYTKTALEIEAQRITDEDFDGPHPNPSHVPGIKYDPVRRLVRIDTPEGRMVAGVGDWIIRGIEGELYPCKHDIFVKTYPQETGVEQPRDKVVEAVRADLLRRSQLGVQKYGVTLERTDLSLKQWLQHAYEETLDQANYLKRAIIEIEKHEQE